MEGVLVYFITCVFGVLSYINLIYANKNNNTKNNQRYLHESREKKES